MDYGKELKKYVDDGAVQGNIGSVEKLCSVIAATHFINVYQQNPMEASFATMAEGLRMAVERLKEMNLAPQSELNFRFHLKTGEVFLWFGSKHQLTWEQLRGAVAVVQSAYEREVNDLGDLP